MGKGRKMKRNVSRGMIETKAGTPLLNKIVISPFFILENPDLRPSDVKKALREFPYDGISLGVGFAYMAAYLVRSAAHKIYIPRFVPSGFPEVEEILKQCPASLAQRIEVVDKGARILNKVNKYFKPIYEEIGGNEEGKRFRLEGLCGDAQDFLYKMALASKLEAEADINELFRIDEILDELKENVKGDEAKFRLDQLYGIHRIYNRPWKIETFTLRPQINVPSIYERVNDLLETAELIELSRSRYFLGIPAKVKIAIAMIRRYVRKILANREYSKRLKAATDFIQAAGSLAGISIPSTNAFESLRSILMSSYNPPLTDLTYFRYVVANAFTPPGTFIGYVRANTLFTQMVFVDRVPSSLYYHIWKQRQSRKHSR